MTRPVLTVIQVTHASFAGFEATGLLGRQVRVLAAYARTFDVVVHSSDTVDYSQRLGVTHRPVRWLPAWPGLRHAAYYLALVLRAPRMRGVLKVFGSNIPTLPLVRRLSGAPMAVTYQFDYASNAAAERGAGSLWALVARVLERLALRAADLVYVTTPGLEARVRDLHQRPTLLLPNWVDRPDPSTGPAPALDGRLILYAGRLHRAKGLEVLLAAFARVRARTPEARLELVGDGEMRPALEARAAALGLAGVTFRGRLEHAQALERMREAAIFVLPTTTREGHPKALLEAMAAGAACVATDVPGSRELLLDGESGLVVPPADPEALADALLRLLADSDLRARLGRTAAAAGADTGFEEILARDIAALRRLAGLGA